MRRINKVWLYVLKSIFVAGGIVQLKIAAHSNF